MPVHAPCGVRAVAPARTTTLRRPRRVTPSVVVILAALACTERAGVVDPPKLLGSGPPAAAKPVLPAGAAVLLTTAIKTEVVDAESIREIRELGARFSQNPIGASGPLELQIRLDITAGTQPCWIIHIREDAWLDGGDGYKLEVSGPNALPQVIQLLRVVDGQVQDFTGQLSAAAGTLRFVAGAKSWSLQLELTGIVIPSDLATGHEVIGATAGSLTLGNVLLPAVIREAEAIFAGDALQLTVASSIEHLDGGGIRERVESAYHFTQVDPVDANGDPRDLLIRYDLTAFDQSLPFYGRIIPRESWLDGGDAFTFAASGPNVPAVFRIVKGVNGNVTDELSEEIASVEARLAFDVTNKAWLLEIELTSVEVIAPMFHPMLGARSITLGNGGSEVSARIREGEIRLF